MSRVTEGYVRYLKYSNDPNLNGDDLFFIFDSLHVWKNEGGREIPNNEIVLKELEKNRFLAHP